MKLHSLLFPLTIVNIGIIGTQKCAVSAYRISYRSFSRKTAPIGLFSKAVLAYKNLLGMSTDEAPPAPVVINTDGRRIAGTNLKILRYPHPKLRAENAVVTEFDDVLKKTVQDLLHVMYAAPGIGLAAPQVGINKRIMVFNENASRGANKKTMKESEKVLINPLITSQSAETRLGNEGCLSFPRVHGKVRRHTSITISYQTLTGEPVIEKLEGFRAVVFQHEYDHLQGVLLADRLVEADRAREKENLDRLVAKYGPGGAI